MALECSCGDVNPEGRKYCKGCRRALLPSPQQIAAAQSANASVSRTA